ncbi:MAG: RHS repeat-associated core domain-containing protein [Deltaproteobacteria bacterium]|nr:RHS repeat-associated core domain-containing protein [Deltaproteobacteria bacterium]
MTRRRCGGTCSATATTPSATCARCSTTLARARFVASMRTPSTATDCARPATPPSHCTSGTRMTSPATWSRCRICRSWCGTRTMRSSSCIGARSRSGCSTPVACACASWSAAVRVSSRTACTSVPRAVPKRRAGVVVERTLTEHVGGALQVDIKLVADGNTIAKPVALRRYALADHLGSVKLEVDPDGKVIAYEEFHSYGTSSYRAMRSGLDAAASRYRYTGMERDEETGLAQHGARYYAAWLGRWTSADPTGLGDGVNRYAYCRGSPVTFSDTNGCDAVSATDPAVLTAMLQAESTRQAAVQHAWRSQMRHALDGVDEVDVAIAAASASEALHGPDLPEASWSGAVENFWPTRP